MARGIVLSVDDSGTTGQVQVDETGERLPFNDPNFPNTGLTATPPNNVCKFKIELISSPTGIEYFADQLKVAPPLNYQTITQSATEDVTAGSDDVITITGSTTIITGNVTVNGGKVIIDQGAQVNGNGNINSDGVMVVKGKGQMKGGITIATGGNLKVVNKGKMVGGIVINQAGRIILGNENGSGSISGGTLDVQQIRGISITADSSINCPGS